MRFGGFIQPQYRLRQNAAGQDDTDGFRLARARFTATGEGRAGNLELGAYVEAELQPTFSLFDAFVTVARALPDKGRIVVDMGQTRVPISRQQLLSDTRISFVEKAQLASIAPDRDLGARVIFDPPKVPFVRVIGGVFNGEGRDQVENINENLLYAGRLEITPWGRDIPLTKYQESTFAGKLLSAGLSVGHNKIAQGGTEDEAQLYLGADLAFAWMGLSGTAEYLEVRHSFSTNTAGTTLPQNYKANGWVAQLDYMIPQHLAPLGEGRFEIGARIEEIDRNDTVPITQPGDPNQSSREFTFVASYYLRQHTMKVQLAASHFTEVENRTATGQDAAYPNDEILLQLTYRVE